MAVYRHKLLHCVRLVANFVCHNTVGYLKQLKQLNHKVAVMWSIEDTEYSHVKEKWLLRVLGNVKKSSLPISYLKKSVHSDALM